MVGISEKRMRDGQREKSGRSEYYGWNIRKTDEGWTAEKVRAGGLRSIAAPQETLEKLKKVIRETAEWENA